MNRPQPLWIKGPSGALEGVLAEPRSAPRVAALLLHPHPLYQGTMENKVVTTLARAVNQLGGASLRFNFRGVGRSEGTYDGGRGEKNDACAAAGWLAARFPKLPLWLMGFSFGGALAFELAEELGAVFLVTVAPPPSMVAGRPSPPCSWIIIQGDADEVVDPKSVRTWATSLSPPPLLVPVAGASHFFHGHLSAIVDAVGNSARQFGLATAGVPESPVQRL